MRTFARQVADRPVLACLLLAPLCLALQSFAGLRVPLYQGDSSPIFLMEAQRMLAGQVIYRDFFELTLPGTQLVYLAFFRVFGARAWVPAVCYILLGTGLAALTAALARRVVNGALALLASAVFLAFAFTGEPDPTHHWYSTTAVMGALVVLIERRTLPRLFAAGALCGVAAVFTQSRGASAAAGLAVFLLWEGRRNADTWREVLKKACALGAGAAASALPVMAWFAARAGVGRFIFCTVTFPLKYFSLWYWNSPQVYLSEVPAGDGAVRLAAVLIWLSLHLLVPLIYLVVVVRALRQARRQPGEPWDRLMLLAVVGLFLFAGIAFSPSWQRLCAASPPAMVLIAWFMRARRPLPTFFRRLYAGVSAAILLFHVLAVQAGKPARLELPAGTFAFESGTRAAKFAWLAGHLRAGDDVYEADDADVYFPLGLREPSPVPFLTATGYTRPDQVRDTLAALERSPVRYILWSVWLDVPRPRVSGGLDPNFDAAILAPLRDFVNTHYHFVKSFGDDAGQEVWEINSSPSGRGPDPDEPPAPAP